LAEFDDVVLSEDDFDVSEASYFFQRQAVDEEIDSTTRSA